MIFFFFCSFNQPMATEKMEVTHFHSTRMTDNEGNTFLLLMKKERDPSSDLWTRCELQIRNR